MGQKFRKHKRTTKPELILNIPVKRFKPIKKEVKCSKANEIIISNEDRIIYIFEYDDNHNTTKVVDVSYEIFINNTWITLVRFDSEHGYLHGHLRMFLNNNSFTRFTAGVKKKGDPGDWLTWSIDHLKNNFKKYRKSFLKNNKLI